MNTTQIKAMLQSERVKANIAQAFTNVFYNDFSVDHIRNKRGQAVLAFKVRNNRLQVWSENSNVTQAYMMATR